MNDHQSGANRPALLACLLAVTLVSACGGGGGGGSSAPPPPVNLASAPGAAALNTYYQSSHTNTLTGTLSGVSLTLTQTFTPISGAATFNGASASSGTETVTLTGGGSTITSSQTVYYTLNPFDPVGAIATSGSPYAVETSFTAIPATVTVGQSGSFNTITAYQINAQGAVEATEVNTYSVVADTPTTLQLCTTGVTTAVANNPDGITNTSETDCYRVDASGNMSVYSIALSTPSGAVTFK